LERRVRILFFGTPQTAVPSLKALLDARLRPLLVVTQPDRPAGRGRRRTASPVKQLALENGLDVHQPEKVRTRSFRDRLERHRPDLIVVVAYGRILPPRVLELPPHGAVNLHFSLLPRYRGAAPVQWALARGETVTGVTTMLMNERMDEGDVLLAREVPIEDEEHSPALAARLALHGASLLLETVEALGRGESVPKPQNHDLATLAPLLQREDGQIDPGLDALDIERRVRGFDPWPGVWLSRNGKRLRLNDVRALGEEPVSDPPGRLLELRPDGMVMACGGGSRLLLRKVQPEGKRPLTAGDAVNGRQIAAGDRLERIGQPD
jgi:methionyl-tRNA formyltransferase